MLRPFRVPTRVLMAPGAISRLPEIVAEYFSPEKVSSDKAPEKVLLVTDPGIEATGWPERIWTALAEREIETVSFDGVEPNPRVSTVDRMAEWSREEGVSLVIGMGGGSVLDAAKAAAMVIPNGGSAADYEGRNRYGHSPLPFLAVPTTCGTGSEVTWVSVLTHEERQAKISVKGETMFPAWAVVDPEAPPHPPRPPGGEHGSRRPHPCH